MTGSVSRRYARALFALAQEQNALEPTAAELTRAAAIAADPDVRRLLRNPLLSAARRRDIAELVVSDIKPSELVGRFIRLLGDNQRMDELPEIQRHFQALLDRALGRVRVAVRSARPLADKQRDAIVAAFSAVTGKQVVPAVAVDAELLGGVVVEAEGRVYDGSVKTHFARIAKELAGTAAL